MVQESKTSAAQRRLDILMQLQKAPATTEQLLNLPVYKMQDKSPEYIKDILEKDLKVLRDSGENILFSEDNKYRIVNTKQIKVSGSNVDITVLRGLLADKRIKKPDVLAQIGVQKLLAQAQVTAENSPYTISVPSGKYIMQIADALERKQNLEFEYAKAEEETIKKYVVMPLRIFIFAEAFYFSGYEFSINGNATGDMRSYKVDRITDKPELIPTKNMPYKVAEETILAFSNVNAIVRIRKGSCVPLLEMAVSSSNGHNKNGEYLDLELRNIKVFELFDYLVFYGKDALLLEPKTLQNTFTKHLRHIASLDTLGENHGK